MLHIAVLEAEIIPVFSIFSKPEMAPLMSIWWLLPADLRNHPKKDYIESEENFRIRRN